MKSLGIIPARYASTRFPGKPLVNMKGKTMIQRVYEQVEDTVDQVVVATDDRRIYDAVLGFGGNVVMTGEQHRSGTDRCAEAYKLITHQEKECAFDIVINIQGDEPFIHPDQILSLKQCFKDKKGCQLATLVKPFASDADFERDLFNSNTPKVVLNRIGEAIYFSRSVIPYYRNAHYSEWVKEHTYYKHIGIYAYSPSTLMEITKLEPSQLEIAESLEQLRWIDNGYRIQTAITLHETIGIDTPEDMEKALLTL